MMLKNDEEEPLWSVTDIELLDICYHLDYEIPEIVNRLNMRNFNSEKLFTEQNVWDAIIDYGIAIPREDCEMTYDDFKGWW